MFYVAILNSLETKLYFIEQFADKLVSAQLEHINLLGFVIILFSGLLTSLNPCVVSMLPVTIAYIGCHESQKKFQGFIQSILFSLGLATTLVLLGIIAALLGKIYGQIGIQLPIFVSIVSILMGFNLLGLISFNFPSMRIENWLINKFHLRVRTYLLGMTFGLVASPCSTPVLATLLTWITSTQNLALGASVLLAYTIGYVSPLILVGTFTATLKQMLEFRRWSAIINPISAILLIVFGIFSLLSHVSLNYFSK